MNLENMTKFKMTNSFANISNDDIQGDFEVSQKKKLLYN